MEEKEKEGPAEELENEMFASSPGSLDRVKG